MTLRFSVTGMTCQHCVKRVTDALSNVPGVTAVKVTLSPPEASVATREEVAAPLLTAAAIEAGDFQLTEIN